ncbi:MAG: hypothetical protein JNM56_27290 [Planctomycetia bacterium]|nr:hypothetical protein [Planctomycetia bacterium]
MNPDMFWYRPFLMHAEWRQPTVTALCRLSERAAQLAQVAVVLEAAGWPIRMTLQGLGFTLPDVARRIRDFPVSDCCDVRGGVVYDANCPERGFTCDEMGQLEVAFGDGMEDLGIAVGYATGAGRSQPEIDAACDRLEQQLTADVRAILEKSPSSRLDGASPRSALDRRLGQLAALRWVSGAPWGDYTLNY